MSNARPSRLHALLAQPAISYALALAACALTAALARLLTIWLDPVNLVMLFLLTVFLVAFKLGRGPAVVSAFVCVGLFDFFFVLPHFSFAVADVQYLVTFVVMLAVALLTGHLTAQLRQQAQDALGREVQTQALYEMARALAGAMTAEQVAEATQRFLRQHLRTAPSLYLPDARDCLYLSGAEDEQAREESDAPDRALARRAFQRGEAVEVSGLSGRGEITLYLPMSTPMRPRGVLEIRAEADWVRHERVMLETVASLAAIALERLHYVEAARAAELRMVSERLRNSVLASLSHDLRTPLTALVGLADALLLEADPATHRDTALALGQQARGLAGMVNNLLDLSRLAGGGLILRREWQPLEEVVGAAIQVLGRALEAHPVRVELAADLPLLDFDAVLLERVFGNLLDNAARHAPPGSPLAISAQVMGDGVAVRVCDQGPGFPDDPLATTSGLGLTICKAILEAHGARLVLENPPAGGACASFTLPRGEPPAIEEEAPEPSCTAS